MNTPPHQILSVSASLRALVIFYYLRVVAMRSLEIILVSNSTQKDCYLQGVVWWLFQTLSHGFHLQNNI